jgi:hypothetical protein
MLWEGGRPSALRRRAPGFRSRDLPLAVVVVVVVDGVGRRERVRDPLEEI